MYLSRFGVKNYKCLGEIDIPLTPIHVLIGENDAGKTSLLEAMAAFFASSTRGLNEIFPEPWMGRELVLHGQSPATIEFWAEWHAPHGYRYGFNVDMPPEGNQCTTPADWIESRGKRKLLTQITHAGWTTIYQWRKKASEPNVRGVDKESLLNAVKPIHKYSFNATAMALPAAINPNRKFKLDADGFGLSTLLDDIVTYEPELFVRLRTEFCRLFPQFTSVRVVTEEAVAREHGGKGHWESRSAHGKGIRFESRSGSLLRAEHASDGAILVLGFLALAHLPDPPNLLLIEEPENGVYPKRLGEVIKILKQMVNREEGRRFPQIILTTHSPFVLSFFEPEEVTFLSRPKDQPDAPVRARPLRDAPNIRERLGSEFYLGELWYNLSEEDLFGEV